ncbi:MAG: SDR family oxidoreductase [Haliea sp.]
MSNVVITGSSKGIGLGLAAEFARRGHHVLISGRTQAAIDSALEKINATRPVTGRLVGQSCDVTEKTQVQHLWDKANEAFGNVDIWINNAGFARTVWPILQTSDEDIHKMVSTNMLGTIHGSKVAANGMLKQGHGKIFTMLGGGSDGEYFPGMGVYGSTKRGLNYFTDALVKELQGSAIVLAKIRPGMVITEGVIREAGANRENFERFRKRMNNLVDTVATVSPYLVDQILACEKSGQKIRWLNGGKIASRMLKSLFVTREDQFKQFGL